MLCNQRYPHQVFAKSGWVAGGIRRMEPENGQTYARRKQAFPMSGLVWVLSGLGFRSQAYLSRPLHRAISGHGVFGLFPLQDQVEQRFCLGLRAKAANLVGAAAELAEETFQQVCGADHALVGKRHPQVVEG